MKVNEIFGPTIQGEGKSAGMPAMFLRLATCNLACIWCDTAYTWNWEGTSFLHPDKYNRKKEVHEMSPRKIKKILKKKAGGLKSLVISGGEPMLQQAELIGLIKSLREPNFFLRPLYWLKLLKPTHYRVEIETNGTVTPLDEFLELIDQINCSPKTSNSGPDNRPEMRERSEALRKLASSEKTNFKFVIQNRDDLLEIKDLIFRYNMKNVYLMAEGTTKEAQNKLSEEVMQICRENNYNFSPRLHVLYWGRKRGV